jgi:hypothetical protein
MCVERFSYRTNRVVRQVVQTLGIVAIIHRLDHFVTIEKYDFAQRTAAWSLHTPCRFLAFSGWGEERGSQVDIYVGFLSERGANIRSLD